MFDIKMSPISNKIMMEEKEIPMIRGINFRPLPLPPHIQPETSNKSDQKIRFEVVLTDHETIGIAHNRYPSAKEFVANLREIANRIEEIYTGY
jgi:hypothetical protein